MQCEIRISSIRPGSMSAAFSTAGRYFDGARPPIWRLVLAEMAVLLITLL